MIQITILEWLKEWRTGASDTMDKNRLSTLRYIPRSTQMTTCAEGVVTA